MAYSILTALDNYVFVVSITRQYESGGMPSISKFSVMQKNKVNFKQSLAYSGYE